MIDNFPAYVIRDDSWRQEKYKTVEICNRMYKVKMSPNCVGVQKNKTTAHSMSAITSAALE